MAKRTLSLTTIKFKPERSNDLGKVDDIAGEDLLHLFHGWVSSLDRSRIKDEELQTYVKVTSVVPRGRSVLVVSDSGGYGEENNSYDTETDAVAHTGSSTEAFTDRTRTLLVVPPGAETALLLIERRGRSGGGPKLFDRFMRALRSSRPGHYFPSATVTEVGAWSQHADLKEVTVVAYAWPIDFGDEVDASRRVIGKISKSLEPVKGERFLPYALWEAIQEGRIDAADYIGFEEEHEVDETIVTVERDNRSKTFTLGTDRAPSIRILLTEDGVPALEDEEFRVEALKHAKDFYEGTLASWQHQWFKGDWSEDELAVRLE